MNDTLQTLVRTAGELTGAEIPIRWRLPGDPCDPATAEPDASWPEWDGRRYPVERAHEAGWLFGEATLPESLHGLPLDGAELLIHIRGYAPFTLWIDGEEMFREEHNWHGTGPIAAPLRRRIVPGEKMRFVLRQCPTAIPAELRFPVRCALQPRSCLETGIELGAAAAQLQMAAALADTPAEKQLVNKAAAAVAADAIQTHDWSKALASLHEMERILSPFSARAKRMVVHLVGHTHIDLGWLWTWEDSLLCTRRDFKATADLLEEFPELTFTNSQVASFEIIRERDPNVFARMKTLMAEGRWENVAMMWDDTDLNMVGGESLARHALYAAEWNREHLGCVSKIFWGVDVFGHPGNMPQIARLAEADGYFHTRCHPDLAAMRPIRIWEGIDGSTIPALFTRYGDTLEPLVVMKRVLISLRCGLDATPFLWGIIDHGGGMSRLQLEILDLYRDKPVMPTFEFSTPSRVFASLQDGNSEMPVTRGETHSQFAGCFTTHDDVKRLHRECENALLNAETAAALAGLDRREALRRAWTGLFFIQFHDVLCGCSAREVYEEDVRPRANSVLDRARCVIEEATRTFVENDASAFTLWNPLGFSRTGPVRVRLDAAVQSVIDGTGTPRPVQRLGDAAVFMADALPSFAGRTFRVSTAPMPDAEAVRVTEEKAFFRIETDCAVSYLEKCSGVITSHYDKALGRELVHYAGNRATSDVPVLSSRGLNLFQLTDCAPTSWSAWNISDAMREENLVRGAEVELLDVGPVFARFRVRHQFRASSIREDVIFYASTPRIDFEATIDWREPGGPDIGVPHLKVAFNTRLSAARARSEGPFAIAERPADGTEQPMQTWVDLTGDEFGFALLNDCKYGYDALGGRLRLSLLRTAYAPDPVSDCGVYKVRFAFLPHCADTPVAELVKAGMSFNRRPVALAGRVLPGMEEGYLRFEGGDSVVCAILRRAEHSEDILLRFFETEGKQTETKLFLRRPIASATEVNFLEHPLGEPLPLVDGAAALRFRPYEIKTLMIRPGGGS